MYIIGNTIKSASEFEVYFLTKAQTKFSLSEKCSLVGSFEGVFPFIKKYLTIYLSQSRISQYSAPWSSG